MEGDITGKELVSLFIICALYQSKRNQAVQETYLFLFHRASFPYARILPFLQYLTTLLWPWHLESYPPFILEMLRVKHQPVTLRVKNYQ